MGNSTVSKKGARDFNTLFINENVQTNMIYEKVFKLNSNQSNTNENHNILSQFWG